MKYKNFKTSKILLFFAFRSITCVTDRPVSFAKAYFPLRRTDLGYFPASYAILECNSFIHPFGQMLFGETIGKTGI